MITILGTTKNQFFSNMIRNITKEPISHIVLEFFNIFVIHSDIHGLHIQSLATFKRDNEIIIRLKPTYEVTRKQIKEKINKLMLEYEKTPYDFGAIIYLGIYLFLKSKLKIKLPNKNLWQTTGMFMCNEWVSKWINETENSMLTPYKFIEKLINSNEWIKIL